MSALPADPSGIPAGGVSALPADPSGTPAAVDAVPVEPPETRVKRVLVAGVGNVLRGDDGFGPAVTERLTDLPDQADVIETGIGGIALLQELMVGCDALVLIDAVDRGAEPGTVFLITPEVREAVHVPDIHLANPDRVLSMAKTIGVLPDRVVIIGCQPSDTDEVSIGLSPAVERAVAIAATKVKEVVNAWL